MWRLISPVSFVLQILITWGMKAITDKVVAIYPISSAYTITVFYL